MQKIFLEHGFELSDAELSQFQKFLSLFVEYNSHTNLSAIRDEAWILEKHFVDSLYGANIIAEALGSRHSDEGRIHAPDNKNPGSFVPQDDGHIRLLDIGSGGGFPGIPLKIVMPELRVTLLDSVGKKVKAMNHFVSELGLTDISALQERAEILAKNPEHAWQYDFVVSRATAYMTDILTWATPFLQRDGLIILYKMPSEDEKRDIAKICNKLKLSLIGKLPYHLGEKDRILYVFRRK